MKRGGEDRICGKFRFDNGTNRDSSGFCDHHVLGAFVPVVFLHRVKPKGNRPPAFLPGDDIEGILDKLSNILAIVYEDFFKTFRCRRYGFILNQSFETKNPSSPLVISADAMASPS